jgi:hypothetical protein
MDNLIKLILATLLLTACDHWEVPDELPDELFPDPHPSDPVVPEPVPPAPTPPPDITLPSNPVCSGVMSAQDGPGGFLWKGAEGNNRLVVLLPGKFPVEFEQVTAVRKSGEEEQLMFTGFANPDGDGERQHWRGAAKPKKYADNSVVTAWEGGNVCQWQIGNANKRND